MHLVRLRALITERPLSNQFSLSQNSRTTFKLNLTCIFLSGRLKLLFTFHYEIPCSDGNEPVTENIHTYTDDGDELNISEYEGYSDGNEGCEVFTWGIWNYLDFALLSEHIPNSKEILISCKFNIGKISNNLEFRFPPEDLVAKWINLFLLISHVRIQVRIKHDIFSRFSQPEYFFRLQPWV